MRHLIIISMIMTFAMPWSVSTAAAQSFDDRIVNILVTSQKHDYGSPWQQGEIRRASIAGCVIEGKRILTSSYSLADHVLIEVMKKGESRKYAATVEIKDYHCGLALLHVEDETFFNGLKPVALLPVGSMAGRSAKVYKWDSMSSLKEYLAELTKTSIRFYEPNCGVLMHQFSTSMNEGGDGEPVFIDNMLAGMATGLNAETKTLFVIGSDMVHRMIRDAADGTYDGIPFFWIDGVDLQSDANLREYYGVAPGEGGVLVTQVPGISSGSDVLKKDDIILSIEGHAIDDRGNYDSPYGKLYFYGLIQLDRFVGDEVSMTVLRDRKKINLRFKLKAIPGDCCTVPIISADSGPRYYIFGGLIFQELSAGYLESQGKDWKQIADKRLLYYFDSIKGLSDRGPDTRIIILSRALPDPVNKGYQYLKDLVLTSINGKPVKNLAEMKRTIDSSSDRFVVFMFAGEITVVLDRELAAKQLKRILMKYNINSSHNLSGK
jgi:S1-C subfamily serine protease